ncbi:unnamed protein product [Boreogadus saida]
MWWVRGLWVWVMWVWGVAGGAGRGMWVWVWVVRGVDVGPWGQGGCDVVDELNGGGRNELKEQSPALI